MEMPPEVVAPPARDAFIPFSGSGQRLDGRTGRLGSTAGQQSMTKGTGSVSSNLLTPMTVCAKCVFESKFILSLVHLRQHRAPHQICRWNLKADQTMDNRTSIINRAFLNLIGLFYSLRNVFYVYFSDYMRPERIAQLRAEKAEASKSNSKQTTQQQSTTSTSSFVPFGGKGRTLR
jgi:hypothetical protein